MVHAKSQSRPQIRSIWGLAKSELKLSQEELYSIVLRETGKESLRELETRELNRVITVLIKLKEKANVRVGMASKDQIWKIKELAKELGWDDNPKRLKAFVKKYYKIENLEWLNGNQAWRLIESLKKLLKKSN